jgi:hypothetical protein
VKVRLSLSLSITRSPKPAKEPEGELIFEHRDNGSIVEATYGGDERLQRMGFQTNPVEPDDHVGMQSARVRYQPPVRTPRAQ